MKKNPLLLSMAMLCVAGASAQAASILFSTTQPTFGGLDITQLSTGTIASGGDNANYIAYDRPVQGQTFTTVGAGDITSITVKARNNWVEIDADAVITLRLSTVTGTTLTPILTQFATVPRAVVAASSGFAEWITFTLTNPLAVSAATVYGFDFGISSVARPFDVYFEIDGAADSSYTGGSAYSSGVNSVGNTTLTARDTDRTFGVTIIPEPSAALLGGLGIMTLLVRRRRA